MTVVVTDTIKHQVGSLQQTMPHALLLTGKRGVGLQTIAREIARFHGEALVIRPELMTKTSTLPQISIERIRDLYDILRTKSVQGRVVIIDDADMMSLNAQHAFLKLLEEPGQRIYFILTSHNAERLLPTVRSRTQSLHIPELSRAETTDFVKHLPTLDVTQTKQLLYIAAGLPAELTRLSENPKYFSETVNRTTLAKTLLGSTAYDRLTVVLKEKFDRETALRLLEVLILMLDANPSPQTILRTNRFIQAYESIRANGNTKLQLARAMI